MHAPIGMLRALNAGGSREPGPHRKPAKKFFGPKLSPPGSDPPDQGMFTAGIGPVARGKK
jgi:hypothetical protein